jgi:HAD superfamily hydrolase (TIGR01450 family)
MHIERLRDIRHVALDMDGTIYKGRTLFDFTPAFLDRLSQRGIGYTFLTNNSSKSAQDYIRHLRGMGIEATPEQIYTSGLCTIHYLRTAHPRLRRLFVVGTPSLCREFELAGYVVVPESEEPEAVIVGFDTALTYSRLCRAAYWIRQGRTFIATHPDFTCPTDEETVLVDCGSVCAALTAATGRRPEMVLGKPDPLMLEGLLARHRLAAHQLAMVGDRLMTDIAMTRAAGTLGVLVLTGEATAEDAARSEIQPDLIVPSIREFGEMLAGGAVLADTPPRAARTE